MDSFLNADADKALQMEIPKYVEDARLAQLADKILSEMDPPLKMKMDRFGTEKNPDFDPNKPEGPNNEPLIALTDFIITEQNGRLVTGAAKQMLQSTLLNDPRVQRAYHEQAFVAGRDFAAKGMNAGQFSSVEQGQEAWANETIKRINAKNDLLIQEKVKEVNKLEKANVSWENYKANNGIIPGSDIDIAMQEHISIAQATQAALDAKMNIQREGNTPSKSLQGTLNKAYNMLMSHNIGRDIQIAAQNFSARDQEYTIRENKFAVDEKNFKYDMAKIRANATNDLNLAAFKAQAEWELARDKGELMIKGNANDLANILKGNNTVFGDAGTIEVPVDDNDQPDQNTDMISRTKDQFVKADNKLMNRQVDNIVNMMMLLNPTGDNATGTEAGDQTYGITLADGTEFRGNVEEIKEKLLNSIINEETNTITSYVNRNLVESLYNTKSEEFKKTRDLLLNNPDIVLGKEQRTQYDNLYNGMFGLNGTNTQMAGVEQFITKAYEDYKKTYDLSIEEITAQNANVAILFKAGFPGLYIGEDNIPLTKEEYRGEVIKGIHNKTITNPDLEGWDTGTSNKSYYHKVKVPTGNTYKIKTGDGWEDRQELHTVTKLDMSAIEAEAGEMYDALFSNLNQYLTGAKGDVTSGDFNSNVAGRGGSFSDAVSQPTYTGLINPMSPNPVAEREMANLILQFNKLSNEGKPFGLITGDINDLDDIEELLQKDPLALKVWNLYKEDLNTWYNNPKTPASTSGKVAPKAQIIYRPVHGLAKDGSKTTASYQLIFNGDWLGTKKKGTNNSTSSEYGSLSEAEIKSLQGTVNDEKQGGQGGITFMFNQIEDINPKGVENTYYSYVETAISASNSGFVDYTVPDAPIPTGNYRIIKVANGQYNIYTKVNTYVPYDSETNIPSHYTTEENTYPADMTYGLEGLDRAAKQLHSVLELKRDENRLALQKDEAVNGKK